MNIHIANRSNVAPLTALALSLALGLTAVHLASGRPVPQAAVPQAPMLASDHGDNVANMSASRKTRCIMPPALRRSCDL